MNDMQSLPGSWRMMAPCRMAAVIGLCLGALSCAADGQAPEISMLSTTDPASIEVEESEEAPQAVNDNAEAQPFPSRPSQPPQAVDAPESAASDACFIDEAFDSSWRPGGDRYNSPNELIEAVRDAALQMEEDPQPVPGATDAETALRRAEMVDSARRRALDHAVLIENDHERATWESYVGERLAARFEGRALGEVGWGLVVSWFQVPQAVCAIDAGDAQP